MTHIMPSPVWLPIIGPTNWILISLHLVFFFWLNSLHILHQTDSLRERHIVCSSGFTIVSAILFTIQSNDCLRPRIFLWNQFSVSFTCNTGLIPSMPPNKAAAAEILPPRFKWFKSFTVNHKRTYLRFSSAHWAASFTEAIIFQHFQ